MVMTDIEKESTQELSDATKPRNTTEDSNMALYRRKFAYLATLFLVFLLVIYGVGAKYDIGTTSAGSTEVSPNVDRYYPMFQHINVMIFIGFGVLMTFQKNYGFSGIGFNFMLAVFTILWTIPMNAFVRMVAEGTGYHQFPVGIKQFIQGDVGAATILISFGALLGKTSPLQMLVMAIVETIFFTTNFYIGISVLQTPDIGGSVMVHMFSTYFGLAVSWMISRSKLDAWEKVVRRPLNKSTYVTDKYAVIGTLFLWIYWPSCHAAMVGGRHQERVIINTILALGAGCCVSFISDVLIRPGNKLNMLSMQNVTLAAGVAIGAVADLEVHPAGAMGIGSIGALLCIAGFVYINPILERKIGLDDVCGIHSLHGIPGIFAGLAGVICAVAIPVEKYNVTTDSGVFLDDNDFFHIYRARKFGRSPSEQGGMQLAVMVITVIISLGSGLLTGLLMKLPMMLPPRNSRSSEDDGWYDDTLYWNVPSDEEAGGKNDESFA